MDTGVGVLHVELAGAVQATCADRAMSDRDLGGRRPRLLLAALVRASDGALTRDELAGILWDGDLPSTWGTALRVAASKARAALGPVLGVDGHDPIVATKAGYALRLPDGVALWVDVDDALAQIEIAQVALAERRATAAVEAIRAARRVLERPFLGEETGAWVERQRAELRQALTEALEAQADAHLGLDQAVLAAAAAQDALDLEPYRESAHRRLITAHVRAGNEGEALRAYERCRRRLREDLGTAPSPETEALYLQLLGEEPPAPAPSIPLPGRLRLVGRDRQLATFDQLLSASVSGHGAIALVHGEAGIGKTRLAREVTDRAVARGARVLWGTCREPEWAPTLGAVVDLLPGLAALAPPELASRLAERLADRVESVPEEDRLQVREDLRRALLAAAQVAPLVVVVDDLHWADEGTIAALRHLGPSIPGAPILVVLTARESEVEPSSPAGTALAALTRDPGLARVPLTPLEATDVADLVSSVRLDDAMAAPSIHARTAGNPFYVEALVLHLLESGDDLGVASAPTAVRDVVAQRTARLGDAARSLLNAAALVEGSFDLATVALAADLDDTAALAAVEEAMAARLVEAGDRPDAYAFCHAIARHSIADAIPPSRRVRLHRRIAEAIEERRAGALGPADVSELAGQYHRSASLPGADRGVEHALRAADHAVSTGSADGAAAFLAMALDLLPPGDERLAALTARRGLALLGGTTHEEGARIVQQAADALVASGDCAAAARLLADGAWTAEVAGFTETAFALASIGMELAAGGPEDDVWARLYVLDLRRQEAHDPRGLGIPIGTPERRRAARLMHADPKHRADMAWAVWDHREEILDRGTDDVWALTMWAGRFHDALLMWQRTATNAEARGQLGQAVNAWAGAASCAVALGHLGDADDWTERARELARRIELRGAFALHLVGARDQLVHARADGFDELMGWVAELTVYRTDRAQRWAEAITAAAIARMLSIEGRHDDAKTMLDTVVEVLPHAPTWVVSTNRMVGDAVGAAWLSSDTRHLGVLADAVRRVLVEPDFRCPMTDPRHVQARLLGLGGEVDGARRWFADARDVAAEDGLRPLEAIIDHDEALLLLRAGHPTEAAPLLDRASKRAAKVGMVGWVRRAERLALGSVG